VELANVEDLFSHPRHPYTEALLSAIPVPDPDRQRNRIILQGEVANPANPPQGCYFHPRCPYAIDRCKHETPVWTEDVPGHFVACHRSQELQLVGAPLID
jgi:peptide/nickel transport system ATP-binding protein